MHEWLTVNLGDMIELKRGYDLPQQSRQRGPIPIVSSSGISDFHIDAKVKGPGVVTGRYGTIGDVYFIDENFWPLNTTLYVRDFKGNDPRFISYFLRGIDFFAYSDKAAVPGLNRNHLHTAIVRYPVDRDEQIAIASILGALDDKIELNRQINQTLEAMARAIFKDWFVDFGPTRAKVEGRAPYVAADLWSLFPDTLDADGKPDGWSTESVYDQAVWVNGAAYKDMHFSSQPDALPVVKIAELKNGITKTTRFTATDLGERYKIHDGELLFSWSGNPDTSIDTFIWTSGSAWLNQHIFAVRPNGKRSQAFLYAMLKFLRSEFAEIARNKQTTGLGHVTQQDLIRLKMTAPDEEVEAAFDDIVGPIHARFTKNLFENQILTATRDLLLPKLMSGEVRVKTVGKLVGAAK